MGLNTNTGFHTPGVSSQFYNKYALTPVLCLKCRIALKLLPSALHDTFEVELFVTKHCIDHGKLLVSHCGDLLLVVMYNYLSLHPTVSTQVSFQMHVKDPLLAITSHQR